MQKKAVLFDAKNIFGLFVDDLGRAARDILEIVHLANSIHLLPPVKLQKKDQIDPVLVRILSDIPNPAVTRALTELRKLVNAIVKEYGKPQIIRIELARELKNPRDRRLKIHKDNEENRKRKEKAVKEILKELNNNEMYNTSANIEKWLLAEECNWECPYTGVKIKPNSLLGDYPQFDVEHIYPRKYWMIHSLTKLCAFPVLTVIINVTNSHLNVHQVQNLML